MGEGWRGRVIKQKFVLIMLNLGCLLKIPVDCQGGRGSRTLVLGVEERADRVLKTDVIFQAMIWVRPQGHRSGPRTVPRISNTKGLGREEPEPEKERTGRIEEKQGRDGREISRKKSESGKVSPESNASEGPGQMGPENSPTPCWGSEPKIIFIPLIVLPGLCKIVPRVHAWFSSRDSMKFNV